MICHGCGQTTDSKYPFYDKRNHAKGCGAVAPKDTGNKPRLPRGDRERAG